MKKYRIVVTEIEHLTHEPYLTDKVIMSCVGFDIYKLLAETVIQRVLGALKRSCDFCPKLVDDFMDFLERDLAEYLQYVTDASEIIPNTSLISRIIEMHLDKISRSDFNFPVFIPEEMDDE